VTGGDAAASANAAAERGERLSVAATRLAFCGHHATRRWLVTQEGQGLADVATPCHVIECHFNHEPRFTMRVDDVAGNVGLTLRSGSCWPRAYGSGRGLHSSTSQLNLSRV
jgi:hypothetical protein